MERDVAWRVRGEGVGGLWQSEKARWLPRQQAGVAHKSVKCTIPTLDRPTDHEAYLGG